MQRPSPTSDKKPYQNPQLRVYGDIREITLTNGMGKGKQDNNIVSFLKT